MVQGTRRQPRLPTFSDIWLVGSCLLFSCQSPFILFKYLNNLPRYRIFTNPSYLTLHSFPLYFHFTFQFAFFSLCVLCVIFTLIFFVLTHFAFCISNPQVTLGGLVTMAPACNLAEQALREYDSAVEFLQRGTVGPQARRILVSQKSSALIFIHQSTQPSQSTT